MNPRLKKLIGMLAMLIFLFFYVVAAITIADHLPRHWLVQVVYFAIIGVAWGVPLFPLLSWMNRETGQRK